MHKTDCPPIQIVEFLGRKWTVTLLKEIKANGSQGFNAMQRRLQHITPKILTERLKVMEEHELIAKKTIGKSHHMRTEYYLTSKGEELTQLFIQIKRWEEKYHTEHFPCDRLESCAECALY